jgi:TATA-binding protein-associated factor Taf7
MKTLREELIDFLRWYRAEWTIPEYKKDEYSVEDYLFEKSNNYSKSDEALNSKSELQNQNNLIIDSLIKLHNMMEEKLKDMESINAPRPDVRRFTNQYYVVKELLRNYFDFDSTGGNSEIMIACKIGDKY